METNSGKPLKRPDVVSCFGQLPQEIVHDILSRLPATSVVQLSFVCRSLSSISRNLFLDDYHLSRSPLNQSQYLILHSDYPIRNQLHFLHLSDEKVRKIDIPFIVAVPEFSVIGSCNGLLCLIDTLFSESIYLYNPFTRDYFGLPKNFDFPGRVVVYGFGFHPVINDYKVIKIFYYEDGFENSAARHLHRRRLTIADRHNSEVEVYCASSNRWESKGPLPFKLEKWSSPGVLSNGRLHWVSRWARFRGRMTRVIVSYNLADDSFSEVTKPGSESEAVGRWVSCRLSTLDGSLCAAEPIPQGHGALQIWVLKEHGASASWVKAHTIVPYYPVSMVSDQLERSSHIWRNMFGKRSLQILGYTKNGELLLDYRGAGLVSYDPCNRLFQEVSFAGIPRIYRTTLHIGSLKSASSLGK